MDTLGIIFETKLRAGHSLVKNYFVRTGRSLQIAYQTEIGQSQHSNKSTLLAVMTANNEKHFMFESNFLAERI